MATNETASRMRKIREMAGAIPEPDNNPGTAVLPADQRALFDDSQLREIGSFDDAVALLNNSGVPLVESQDYVGSGFTVEEEKKRLEGIPLLLMSWRFNESKVIPGATFVSVNVVTKNGDKLIVNDGTKGGIRDQLLQYTKASGRFGGMLCAHGLNVSTYPLTDDDGNVTGQGTSYYIA